MMTRRKNERKWSVCLASLREELRFRVSSLFWTGSTLPMDQFTSRHGQTSHTPYIRWFWSCGEMTCPGVDNPSFGNDETDFFPPTDGSPGTHLPGPVLPQARLRGGHGPLLRSGTRPCARNCPARPTDGAPEISDLFPAQCFYTLSEDRG